MAKKVHLSPGTYVSEKDLTFTVEALGVTTLGLVGETVKGPAFQPLFVKNYDEFKTLYGGTSPEKFRNTQIPKFELPYIAKSYLTQSNQLYITRILGLSGYNKGNAYAIKTIGSAEVGTLSYDLDNVSTVTVDFKYDTGTSSAVPQNIDGSNNVLMTLAAKISQVTGIAQTKFDQAFATYFSKVSYTSKAWYIGDILEWGAVPTEEFDAFVSGSTVNTSNSTPTVIDAYELSAGAPSGDAVNDWLQTTFTYNTSSSEFEGLAFALYCYDFTTLSGSVIKGKMKLITVDLTATAAEGYHSQLVGTLRSRGEYIADELSFYVETAEIADASNISSDAFGSFLVTGTTGTGTFSYNISLDKRKKNYAKNVLGVAPHDKEANLYVEEIYDSVLAKGVKEGKIKGLSATLTEIADWGHYRFQYQAPVSPFFVSELRGGTVQRLFRAISISDGNNANTEVKLSIANVDLDKKVFDLYVRAYNDSDKAPVILERYINCSMDENLANYVGKKIGTIDNKYDLKSSYVILEMADKAPKDAVPCGFEGYEFRTAAGISVPDIFYKTKYYSAGEVIVDPLVGSPVISNGDKVKKTYLGFTDLEYGFDSDLLSFKGKVSLDGLNSYNDGVDYDTVTKGFHLDVNAPLDFTTGVATFDDLTTLAVTTHPYHDIKTRKFTCLLAGGWDGWDEFRDNRTNVDNYKIGRAGFVAGGFDIFTSVEYDEIFGTSDYYAYLYGAKTFENPESTVINILSTPGIDMVNNTELVREVIEIIEEKRGDSIYLPTLPDMKLINNTAPSNTDDWFFPNDIVQVLEDTEIDSNYTAVYYPWIQVLDTENNANLFIPPTAEVVRNLAYTDNIAHPWYATAGYSRGIVNTKKARLALNGDSRDTLYNGKINPLLTTTDVGVLIWGNRNLQEKDSPTNRINVRRLLLQAKKLIVSVANRLLFDPNDAQVRNSFLSQVNPILDNIRKERGLVDFRVVLTPQDAQDVDRNTLKGKIFIKPMDTLEFIELEFNVTPTEVSFDSI